MVTTDHEFIDSDFDEYSAPSPRSLMCCRIVAIIVQLFLFLTLSLSAHGPAHTLLSHTG